MGMTAEQILRKYGTPSPQPAALLTNNEYLIVALVFIGLLAGLGFVLIRWVIPFFDKTVTSKTGQSILGKCFVISGVIYGLIVKDMQSALVMIGVGIGLYVISSEGY